MFSTVSMQRLSVGSIFKLWFVGLSVSFVPLGLFFGVLSLFGFDTVKWNDEPLHGVTGLLASPLIGLFVALLFTGMLGSCSAFGLWLYSKVRPLSLEYKSAASQNQAA